MTQLYDKDGKLIDEAARSPDGQLKDGQVLRIPMHLMDAAPPDITAITRAALADVSAPDLARHRPGTLVVDGIKGEIAATAREVLREHRLTVLSDAWRNPPMLKTSKLAAPAADAADPDAAAEARDQRLRDAWVTA